MNSNDPLPKATVDLLRAPLPDSAPRPGLETRLLAQVREASPTSSFPLRYALAGVFSLLLIAALLFFNNTPSTPIADTPEIPAQPVLELNKLPNPLGTEAEAIRDTATRTGNFLISLLPSIPDPEQSL